MEDKNMKRLVIVEKSVIKELAEYSKLFEYLQEKEKNLVTGLKMAYKMRKLAQELHETVQKSETYNSYAAAVESYNSIRGEIVFCKAYKETIEHQIIRLGSPMIPVPGGITKISKTDYAKYILSHIDM